MSKLYDRKGIPFEQGDVVRVFDFVGARRKRHYMYKHVVGERTLGQRSHLMLSHLDLSGEEYAIIMDESTLEDYEIVQSADAGFEERPRKPIAGSDLHSSGPGKERAK